jgi:hypothetical protein
MNTKFSPSIRRGIALVIPLLLICMLAACHHHPATPDQQALMDQMAQQGMDTGETWKTRFLAILLGTVVGALVGAFFSQRARPIRFWLAAASIVVLCVYCMFVNDGLALFGSAALSGAITYVLLSLGQPKGSGGFEPIFGDARPATRGELVAARHMPAPDGRAAVSGAIPLGYLVETTPPGGSS